MKIVDFHVFNSNLLLQRQDARIIVGVFYEDMARRVFCQVILLITFNLIPIISRMPDVVVYKCITTCGQTCICMLYYI